MARSQTELQQILSDVEGVQAAYFQAPSSMKYPCIKYQRDNTLRFDADNVMYLHLKRYQVTVLDRDPDSLIPDLVEALPHTGFDRFYIASGINHWAFITYF